MGIKKRCIVPCCSSKTGNPDSFSFHTLPKDLARVRKWQEGLRLPYLPKSALICALHFKPKDILTHKVFRRLDKTVLMKVPLKTSRLRPDAVPRREPYIRTKIGEDVEEQPVPEEEEAVKFESIEPLENEQFMPESELTESDSQQASMLEKIESDNSEFEELFENASNFTDLLFGNVDINLPNSWTKIVPLETHSKCVVFANFTLNGDDHLTPWKQIRVWDTNHIQYFFNGKEVFLDYAKTFVNVEMLENVIYKFHNADSKQFQ